MGAIQEQCLFNIVAYGGQLFSFWGSAGMLHIQMNYKYKRMIFFPNSWRWSHLQLAHQSNVFGITSGGLIDLW